MSLVLNIPQQVMGSEYALIYMNMSNFTRILKMPKSAEIWANMPQYV